MRPLLALVIALAAGSAVSSQVQHPSAEGLRGLHLYPGDVERCAQEGCYALTPAEIKAVVQQAYMAGHAAQCREGGL